MKERISWKLSLLVIIAAIPMALMYAYSLPDLLAGRSSPLSFVVGCMLYSSLIIRATIWLSYNKEQSVSHNLQRLTGYLGMYMAAFVVSGLVIGVQGRNLLPLIVIVALYATPFVFETLKDIFRQGWGSFLMMMMIPLLLIVLIVLISKGMASNLSLYELYNVAIIAGISYWVLISIVLMLFSRHILKRSKDSSSV